MGGVSHRPCRRGAAKGRALRLAGRAIRGSSARLARRCPRSGADRSVGSGGGRRKVPRGRRDRVRRAVREPPGSRELTRTAAAPCALGARGAAAVLGEPRLASGLASGDVQAECSIGTLRDLRCAPPHPLHPRDRARLHPKAKTTPAQRVLHARRHLEPAHGSGSGSPSNALRRAPGSKTAPAGLRGSGIASAIRPSPNCSASLDRPSLPSWRGSDSHACGCWSRRSPCGARSARRRTSSSIWTPRSSGASGASAIAVTLVEGCASGASVGTACTCGSMTTVEWPTSRSSKTNAVRPRRASSSGLCAPSPGWERRCFEPSRATAPPSAPGPSSRWRVHSA